MRSARNGVHLRVSQVEILSSLPVWRCGRVLYATGLENQRTLIGSVSWNLTVSTMCLVVVFPPLLRYTSSMRDMEKWKLAQKAWYERVVKVRRREWFEKNGPCVDCGTWDHLELDHVDPKTKISHAVWSWGDRKRTIELAKCKVRCHGCHLEKTKRDLREMDVNAYLRIVDPPGMAWCCTGAHFAPIGDFSKNKKKRRGLQTECRYCRSKTRNKANYDTALRRASAGEMVDTIRL